MISRRHLFGGITAAGALAALAGCADRTPGAQGTPSGSASPGATDSGTKAALTVGLTYIPDIQFAAFYVADKSGYFTDEGVNVTLRHHGASEPLLGALNAGTEHVVFAGGDEMMQARSQGTDVVDFATLYQRHPACLIAKKSAGITKPADIKGKKVGLPGGYGEGWFFLLALLKQVGLAQTDITVMKIGFTQRAALVGDRCDAVIGFINNDVVQLREMGVEVNTIELDSGGPSSVQLVGAGLGATSGLITSQPEALRGVVKAVRRALADIVKDPQVAVAAARDYVATLRTPDGEKAALATLAASLPLYGDPGSAGKQDPAAWASMASFMDDAGLLAKPVSASDAFTSTLAG